VSVVWRAIFLSGAFFASTTICSATLADSARIALVRPGVSTPAITEALTRIQGELTADGFRVVLVDSVDGLDSASTIEGTRQDGGALASVGIFVDAGAHVAELRVIDRLTNKIVVRRTAIADTETSRLAEVLAVRAVELLRASLLELLIESRPLPVAGAQQSPPAEARQASQWAAHSLRQDRQSTWAVEAGTAVILGFGGIGPALLGVLRVCGEFIPPLSVRLTVAGLGTTSSVEAMRPLPGLPPFGAASASVSQQLGLVEFVARPWEGFFVHPILSIGAGALNVAVAGQVTSPSPYEGLRSYRWSFAADVGAGAQLRLSQRFDLSFEVHAFVAEPYPVVTFLGTEVARGGQPSLLASVTVVGWL
jgi:hypothetical protein